MKGYAIPNSEFSPNNTTDFNLLSGSAKYKLFQIQSSHQITRQYAIKIGRVLIYEHNRRIIQI